MPICFPPAWVSWVPKISGIEKKTPDESQKNKSWTRSRCQQVESHRGVSALAEVLQTSPGSLQTEGQPISATESSFSKNTRQQLLRLCSLKCVFPQDIYWLDKFRCMHSLLLEVDFWGRGRFRGEEWARWPKERVPLGHRRPEFTSLELLHLFWVPSLAYWQNRTVFSIWPNYR